MGAEFGAADSGALRRGDDDFFEKSRVSEGRLLLLVINGGEDT